MNTATIPGKPKPAQGLPGVSLPLSYNYIGAFLTFRCPYRCSYCINRFNGGTVAAYRELPGRDWIRFFERLDTRDVPITLQGGEPGIHPDFLDIIHETLPHHPVDILTNLAFDLKAFTQRIDPQQLNREAPYAPIRVSYHPSQFSLKEIVGKILYLMDAGFRVGLYGVQHPDQLESVEEARKYCLGLGIDFRTKPYLGWHNGIFHGAYSHPDACLGKEHRHCECATSELLVAPDGSIHRCHRFLYNRLTSLAHIRDVQLRLSDDYTPCDAYGQCNPCDIKVKNNRFQQFGHIATRIRNIQPPSP